MKPALSVVVLAASLFISTPSADANKKRLPQMSEAETKKYCEATVRCRNEIRSTGERWHICMRKKGFVQTMPGDGYIICGRD